MEKAYIGTSLTEEKKKKIGQQLSAISRSFKSGNAPLIWGGGKKFFFQMKLGQYKFFFLKDLFVL
jgi:hypothetical protein